MADETKYKKRPTRKVVRSLRMPASARGGYEVPEEATWEDEEEIAPHMEIDPVTGEEYAPRGLEESELGGPEMLIPAAGVAKTAGTKIGQGAMGIAKAIGRKAGKDAARRTFQESEKELVKSIPKLSAEEAVEDLDLFFSRMKKVKPELGQEKPPSTASKVIDKYKEWKDNQPAARRKLQEHLDWRQRTIEEAELEQKRLEMDELLRQERIREAGGKASPATKPPTEIE